jgi:heptosyltransferase-2
VPSRNLAGKTSLRELCAILFACRVAVGNDSGAMHVAAAVGTPSVVIFGSTSPELTCPGMPGDPRHSILTAQAVCSPCFLRECPIDLRCLTGIDVSGVVSSAMARWNLKADEDTDSARMESDLLTAKF